MNKLRYRLSLVAGLLTLGLFSGCASWTNPVANGIPVRLLPEELLAESKDDYEYIPWGLLQRTPPEKPLIQPDDILGIYVVGVLGAIDQPPPVQLPDAANVPPSIGYPIPVRADGTIPLSMIDDPKVAGLTVEQAEKKLIAAFTDERQILNKDQTIILSMIRPKHVRVLVVRQDALGSRAQQFVQSNRGFLAAPVTGNASRQGAGFELQIPATEADVLSALAETGGLPGLDAKDDILIYRKKATTGDMITADVDRTRLSEPERISLKIRKGENPNISEAAVSLADGDIVVVETRESEQYYTAGLMFNQEVPLPFDYDLTVIEAVARIGGPLMNGGFGGANLNGNIVSTGLGNPNPSLLTVLRKADNGRQIPIRVDLTEALRDPRENIIVKNGDILVLQETTGESFARYMTNVFNFNGSASISRVNGVTNRSGLLNGSAINLP